MAVNAVSRLSGDTPTRVVQVTPPVAPSHSSLYDVIVADGPPLSESVTSSSQSTASYVSSVDACTLRGVPGATGTVSSTEPAVLNSESSLQPLRFCAWIFTLISVPLGRE